MHLAGGTIPELPEARIWHWDLLNNRSYHPLSEVKDEQRPQDEYKLVTTFYQELSVLPFGLLGLDPWGLWWEM